MQCLYTGLLSKSRGVVLRVATVVHLFSVHKESEEIPDAISTEALSAAIDFVQLHVNKLPTWLDEGKLKRRCRNSRMVC